MVSWAFSANFPSRGAPYSCPFRLSFYSQQVSPPWVHAPNPTFQHPAPLCNRRHTTQPGVRRVVAQTMHSSYFVLLSTDHQLHSPLIPRRSLSVPADFPTMRGFFWLREPLLTFSFAQGLLVPLLIPLFFFSFFHPTQWWGYFSYLFRCLKSFTNVQQVLFENCSIRWCILDVLVRRDKFHVLLFFYLDYSPSIDFLM